MPLRDEIPQRIIFRRHPALLQAVLLVIGLLCGYRYPTFYSPIFILLGAFSSDLSFRSRLSEGYPSTKAYCAG